MQNKRACELKDKHNIHESEWKDPNKNNKKFLHQSYWLKPTELKR